MNSRPYIYDHVTRTVVYLPPKMTFAQLEQWLKDAQRFFKARGQKLPVYGLFDSTYYMHSAQVALSPVRLWAPNGPGIVARSIKMGREYMVEMSYDCVDLSAHLSRPDVVEWGVRNKVVSIIADTGDMVAKYAPRFAWTAGSRAESEGRSISRLATASFTFEVSAPSGRTPDRTSCSTQRSAEGSEPR